MKQPLQTFVYDRDRVLMELQLQMFVYDMDDKTTATNICIGQG